MSPEMASPSRKILVLGATGVIGKVLLNALLNAKNSFDRIGILTSAETLTNKPELIESFKARGADILTGDLYKDDDVLEAYKGEIKTERSVSSGFRFQARVLTRT